MAELKFLVAQPHLKKLIHLTFLSGWRRCGVSDRKYWNHQKQNSCLKRSPVFLDLLAKFKDFFKGENEIQIYYLKMLLLLVLFCVSEELLVFI